jgi:hypothetical protein
MITLNKIKDILNTIANKHPQINHFGFGEIENVNTIKEAQGNKFPMLWIVPQQAILDENVITYRLRFLVFDQDTASDNYRTDILSSTLLILGDVVRNLKYVSNDYNVIGKASATPFSQDFADYCTGWYSDVDIETDINNNPCDLAEE